MLLCCRVSVSERRCAALHVFICAAPVLPAACLPPSAAWRPLRAAVSVATTCTSVLARTVLSDRCVLASVASSGRRSGQPLARAAEPGSGRDASPRPRPPAGFLRSGVSAGVNLAAMTWVRAGPGLLPPAPPLLLLLVLAPLLYAPGESLDNGVHSFTPPSFLLPPPCVHHRHH